jgi:NADPH:quinone reductase-like Zn-dependent oxidoreductase
LLSAIISDAFHLYVATKERLMKAMVFERHGPPDVLEYKDVPMPTIGPNEVLFKVMAAGFNYNDVWARQGANVEYPLPLSAERAAGVVVEWARP